METCRHVVALPHPGRGHINPMLNLCRRLASRASNLLITFIVTEEWLTLLSSASPLPSNIRLRAIPNVLPSEHARGADVVGFFQAVMTKMESPVEELLGEEGVDAIIADSILPWAPKIADRRRVPVYSFFTQSAAVFLALHRLAGLTAAGQLEIDFSGEGNECLKYRPRIFTRSPTGSNEETIPSRFIQFVSWYSTAQGVLFSSFNDLESHTFTILKSKLSVPVYPVGPSIPYEAKENESTNSDYFKWLDSQQKGSVLFISLGSFLSIAGDQITEMAMGLKISGIPFLWTARGETQRIEELSGGKGFVAPWCDQLAVLCHPSVGGFLSHCGWNSTMEAVYAGVPMLTFPLIWDQYPNSDLVVDEWKKGFTLKKGMEADGVVGREAIAMGVRKLMDSDSKDGKEVRRRAKELGEMCGKSLEENGSSSADIDAFVKELLQA